MTGTQDEETSEEEDEERSPWMRARQDPCEPCRMTETLYRHWMMLRELPRAPRKLPVSVLHQRLHDMGQAVTRRSVERDLVKLSAVFPIECDGNKPAGWFWPKDAASIDIPGMDPHAAITYRLVEQQLSQQLPRSTLKVLEPHFKRARAVLSALRKEGLPAWAEKVRAIPRGQSLRPPRVSSAVLGAVHDALLHGRCLDVSYRNAEGALKQGELHPLGLVYRDAVGVLLATWSGYRDVRHHPLHRIESARMSEKTRSSPAGFSLDQYVTGGSASFVLDPRPFKLVVRVAPQAAHTLLDTPFNDEQKTAKEQNGWVRVEATLPSDTRALRAFLLGFGPTLEVVAPKRLRAQMRTSAEELRALYADA